MPGRTWRSRRSAGSTVEVRDGGGAAAPADADRGVVRRAIVSYIAGGVDRGRDDRDPRVQPTGEIGEVRVPGDHEIGDLDASASWWVRLDD